MLIPELKGRTADELIKVFLEEPPEHEREYAASYYSEVAYQLAKLSPERSKDFFLRQLQNSDNRRVRGAIEGLNLLDVKPEWFAATVHRFLDVARHELVAETLCALAFVKYSLGIDRTIEFCRHTDPFVVGAGLRLLARSYPKIAAPILLDALSHDHNVVRSRACDELDDLEIVEAIPKLKPLLQDPHPDVRQAAAIAIENLSPTEPSS